jgi:fructosamine-3-kinase
MNYLIPNKLIDLIKENFNERYTIRLEIEDVNSIGGGCINEACKLKTSEGCFFLKWNMSGAADIFIREEEALNELLKTKNEFLTFPVPVLSKQIDETPGYLLTEYLEINTQEDGDEIFGRGLAYLHKTFNDKFGFQNDNYCGKTIQKNTYKSDWIQFYQQNRILHLIGLIKNIRDWNTSDQALTEKFLFKTESLIKHKPPSSLVHGDLWSGNYMNTTKGPAIYDPAASYSDREFEFGIMTMFGGFSKTVYDSYNEEYPLSKEWKERNKIYQLYHVLNHYYLFGGYYKEQALSIMKHYC